MLFKLDENLPPSASELLRALESSSVSSTRRARIFEIGVHRQYQPEARASAYSDPSMIEFIE
jgi:hypothetical protein